MTDIRDPEMSTIGARQLLDIAETIDNRLGPIPGALADRIAVVLRQAAEAMAAHDARVTELLHANNREVERRRHAEAALRVPLDDADQDRLATIREMLAREHMYPSDCRCDACFLLRLVDAKAETSGEPDKA